jgi:C4-type Zn-finger protein
LKQLEKFWEKVAHGRKISRPGSIQIPNLSIKMGSGGRFVSFVSNVSNWMVTERQKMGL